LVTAVLSLAATAVSSEVRLDLQACAEGGSVPNVNCDAFTTVLPSGTHVENAISFQTSFAAGLADLTSGTLRATARSANDSIGASTSAVATLGDTVTFSGGFGQTAFLDYTFRGSITEASNPIANISLGSLVIYIANPSLGGAQTYGLALSTPFGCAVLNFANASLGCYEAASIDLRGSIPFELQPGDFYFLNALGATASAGDFVDFGNSAHFSLRLPEGVTYTSQTGQFLTATAPPPIPEPETVVLLGAGLAALGWWQSGRRRRSRGLAQA